MAALRLSGDDLACDRGGRRVFAGKRFAIEAGGALALLGPNGAGKSTLLRLIAGLLPPAAGTLAWNGVPVASEPDQHRASLNYLGHLDAVKPTLTPIEGLAFHTRLRGALADRLSLLRALDALGLADLADLPARFLSQGQRRRLALARLLAIPAPLWLLDEPASGLDAASLTRLQEIIARHRAGGGMVIAATHGGLDLGAHDVLDLSRVTA